MSTTQGIKTVLHPVSDLAKAKAVNAGVIGNHGEIACAVLGYRFDQ